MDGHDSDDPKQTPADMTAFVQNLLQQMQSRFQAMSETIVTKNILSSAAMFSAIMIKELETRLNLNLRLIILDCNALDEMGNRINELEESINELKAEMGADGSPSSAPPSKSGPDECKPEEGSA